MMSTNENTQPQPSKTGYLLTARPDIQYTREFQAKFVELLGFSVETDYVSEINMTPDELSVTLRRGFEETTHVWHFQGIVAGRKL